MFTGIVTAIGTVRSVEQRGDLRLVIATDADLADAALGASIACSGVCLTLVDRGEDWFAVDVSAETRSKTAADRWREGSRLNLERSLRLGDELGGHLVTGHVDSVGTVRSATAEGDSTRLDIAIPVALAGAVAPKGSVAVDGVSLTVNSVADRPGETILSVNVIPHTAAVTTLGALQPGNEVHIEVDVLARYVARALAARTTG